MKKYIKAFLRSHKLFLKKRAILELIGLIVLLFFCYGQRDVLRQTIADLRQGNISYILLAFACYWAIPPLTGATYRLITGKNISILSLSLTQLAGAGPGRIIPGGLGGVSIFTIRLRKFGLSLREAVLTTATNNLFGVIANTILIIIAVVIDQSMRSAGYRVITKSIWTLVIGFSALILAYQWLRHMHKIRKFIVRTRKSAYKIFSRLIHKPKTTAGILAVASLNTLTHVIILVLAGKAININISPTEALLAMSAGVLVGGVVPTPGGLGVVEAGIASTLVLFGYEPAQAASAAILYRGASYWQPLLPGVASYAYLKRKNAL